MLRRRQVEIRHRRPGETPEVQIFSSKLFSEETKKERSKITMEGVAWSMVMKGVQR